ncbi:putative E3 ubiquitin-protein ligase dma1 [Mycena sanguinolenta]|uniref:Putative E3 ubiquitin-protein ligase dma1 n=1 Tax=Mycena sanguinolenta TaxID=230812 RepID=A0A8H6ZG99_9AGAR|nr:putative E3 ubiquitin-protein ligase dma1 [Mycena sanguinolenta]
MQAAPSAGGGGGLSLGGMLRRRRSAGNMIPATPVGVVPPVLPATAPRTAPIPAAAPPAVGSDHGHGQAHAHAPSLAPGAGAFGHLTAGAHPAGGGGGGGTHRIRLVPHLDSRRSLRFDPISRDLKPGEPALRIGRFTDRSGLGLAAVNALSTNKIAFKSKVVSRAHAEVWIEETGGGGANNTRFLIKDTKSSSGTFLNHVRLSAANTESRPHPLKDGDILQLGVDYQGGAEDIYKSVKIRVEIGREWQREANAFNTAALKNLRSLAIAPPADGAGAGGSTLGPGAADGKGAAGGVGKRRKGTSMGIPDCCICLFPVSIRQALFIAPCSHTFHYKCLRPLLEAHHPAFSCPLCRTFADLEEDVEVEIEEDDEFENPDGFAAETPLVPHPALGTALPEEVMEEGVLADDLEAEEGDEVDELYAVPPGHHMRFAGAETEVEDNGAHSS